MSQVDGRDFVVPFTALKGGVYVIGERGAGKTTFLNNLILSITSSPRLFNAASIVCLDPHGDQTFELLRSLPDLEPVGIFDPYRACFSLNMLQLPVIHGLLPREQVIEYLVGSQSEAFAQALNLSPARAPRAMAICRAEIQAVVASRDDATWSDVYQLNKCLMRGDSYEGIVRRFHLNREFSESLSPIAERASMLSDTLFAIHYRLDSLIHSQTLYKTFCGRKSNVDFRKIIEPMNVSVFRFSSMEIPSHVQSIAFANIVMNLWCTALERARLIQEPEKRSPIFLIVDEFQIVGQLTILEIILAQLRKVALYPILCHQNLAQLNDKLIMTVLANTALQAVFSTSTEDAQRLARNLDPYRSQELTWSISSLPRYEAICRAKWGSEDSTPTRIRCLPPPPTLRSMEEVSRYLESVKEQRLSAVEENERGDLPKWLELYSIHKLPAPSLWPIVLALIEFENDRRAVTVTALSTSSLMYIPRNKYRLIELLQNAVTRGFVEAVRVGERTVYRLSESERQVLFAYPPSGEGAKAGLYEHRAMKSIIELRYAQLMYCPLRIEQKEAREDPDGVLLRASEEGDTWDIRGATALEVEVWPEKHPDRIKWHVINDLNNLGFDRILFAVSDDGKRDWLLKFLHENCREYFDRITVELVELDHP
jgi:hypothetical protein